MLEYFFGPLAVAAIIGWCLAVFKYPIHADRVLKPAGAAVGLMFLGYMCFAAGYTRGMTSAASGADLKALLSTFHWESSAVLAFSGLFVGTTLVYGPWIVRVALLGWDYPKKNSIEGKPEHSGRSES